MSQPFFILFVCLLTTAVSIAAWRDKTLHSRLLFQPSLILSQKEWHRLFSSALVHADFMHLGFNLLTLYLFGEIVEMKYGWPVLALIYVGSIGGGSLLSLYLHRYHEYSAHGASGGVCGVLFASIFLIPGIDVGYYFLPIGIPGPIFAIIYLAGTFVALRRDNDNIGHDAHFGGAIVGLLLAGIVAPDNCLENSALYLACLLFSAGCLYFLSREQEKFRPSLFFWKPIPFKPNLRFQRYDEAQAAREKQQKIDNLLDRVARNGLGSLSEAEKALLIQYSEELKRK